MPPQLDAFVLPGMDVARARGLDVESAGLRPVATPRHAAVLLIVGELPESLWDAATVVYAQMARPRAIVALGGDGIGPLPGPDASAAMGQAGLEGAIERVRRLLRTGSWSQETEPFEAAALLPKRRTRRKKKKPAEPPAAERPSNDGTANDGAMHHGAMGGGADMGFMSMVRLTQHLPKGADGLPMERVQTPFGPFFPGLPSGLALTLWLDGDTVAQVEVASPVGSRKSDLSTGSGDLAERWSRRHPFAPAAYRRLVEAAAGGPPLDLGHVAALELERAASHLNWLADFGHLLGYAWLERHAAAWQRRLRTGCDLDRLAALEPKLLAVLQRVPRTPLLARRLTGVGVLDADELEGVGGPVARAAGLVRDARLDEPRYRSLGFEPVVRPEGDALARLSVRLDEIRRSVTLALAAYRAHGAAGAMGAARPEVERRSERPVEPGSGAVVDPPARAARIETPRGVAALQLRTNGDGAAEAVLETPSTAVLPLVEKLAVGQELADALVAISSLDLSPWEVVQ
ncbi:MAG: hypothetical protein P1P87_01490 [Trueperaceae bacterium]|nr:hypothetical protein [Trueperaceae bacterium]